MLVIVFNFSFCFIILVILSALSLLRHGHVTVTDDNFNSIVKAVMWDRYVYYVLSGLYLSDYKVKIIDP